MCGIVASVSSRGRVSSDGILAAARRLVHRGPDNQTAWTAAHGRSGLGHARLSIIDLTTGDQPIANEDEPLHIVANGEFYDFERIRRELEARGHRFRTRSDSEIALHLYEDLGARCLHQLRGEFAFAIWDERDGVLFAARDRFGIKPLYYAVARRHLLPRVGGEGARSRWGAAALGPRVALRHPLRPDAAPSRIARSSTGSTRCRRAATCSPTARTSSVHQYWDFDYPHGRGRRGGRGIRRKHVERLRATS